MDAKNKNKRLGLDTEVVTQHTELDELTEIILSNRKDFLISSSVEHQIKMMHKCRDLYVKYGSRIKVVKKLTAEHGMSESWAWKLVDITPKLFSLTLQSITRDFHVDILLQEIAETRQIAKDNGDAKTMAMCDANKDKLIEKYMGTKELIDQEKLHLPDVELGFYPPQLFEKVPDIGSDELKAIEAAFRRKKHRKEAMNAIDIDHEVVK
jgi:hypothetical protein